jgi:hypothetical protein
LDPSIAGKSKAGAGVPAVSADILLPPKTLLGHFMALRLLDDSGLAKDFLCQAGNGKRVQARDSDPGAIRSLAGDYAHDIRLACHGLDAKDNEFVIGLIGTAGGAIFGLAASAIMDRYQLIKLPPDVYQITYLPFRIELVDVAVVILSAIGVCLIATIYPSRQAARIDPAEALRNQ